MFENSSAISILRSVDRHRRFLIMIRCGSTVRPSLFRGPLANDRNFDVAVNYFAPPHAEDFFYQHAEFLVAGGVSKIQSPKKVWHAGSLVKYEGIQVLGDN